MSTALYRRYRPETFAEVIGQEHVTEPLMAALAAGRVTHAYLFSGPRGCGKTSSARIFARCLNCAEGPTPTPCGVCDSCVELGRGGSGSLDVVEIDAASHNGVDDARDLRERAIFAPARDRFKIFILDEAHMVTTQGFNALLKLVEEPPEHVKFIFATTEPEKVIGTIRSRTHHYPFRLVPPGILTGYLESLCVQEGVEVGAGVLPMVVRAGGGSVRDSLSVLDQLMAGSVDRALDYERAAALLGYTSATLLDDAVAALAAYDGGALFQVVDRMVQSGHDPRRFVEDFLQRLRDLVIIAVAGDAAGPALGSVPADQLALMQDQARHLGAAAASRAADLTNSALSEMTGATSPRLQVELLCARLLIGPGAPAGPVRGASQSSGTAQVSSSGGGSVPASAPAAAGQPERPARARGAAPSNGTVPSSAPGGTSAAAPAPAGPRAGEPAQESGAPAPAPERTAPAAPQPESTSRTAPPHMSGQAATDGGAGSTARAEDRRGGATVAQPAAPSAGGAAGIAAAARRASAALRAGAPAQGNASPEPAAPQAARSAGDGPVAQPETGGPTPAAQPTAQRSPEAARSSGASPEGNPEPGRPTPAAQPTTQRSPEERAAWQRPAQERPQQPASHGTAQPTDGAAAGAVDTAMVRRRWNEVLETLAQIRRTSWALVAQSATPGEVRGGDMSLIFETEGLKSAFTNGRHEENVVAALRESLGVSVRIVAVTGAAAPVTRENGEPDPEPDPEPHPEPDDGVSEDDETIENSAVFGVPVIERILGGTIVEDGAP